MVQVKVVMNPYHAKLAAAEQILADETWDGMRKALDYWPLFFAYLCPAFDSSGYIDSSDPISSSYETLRQRAHEFVTNHRLSQIEERLQIDSNRLR